MHQRDEEIQNYLEMAKALYKELLTVHKKTSGSDETMKIEVTSKVYEIALTPAAENAAIFPGCTLQLSRCYVVVDAVKRYATVVYSPYKPFW